MRIAFIKSDKHEDKQLGSAFAHGLASLSTSDVVRVTTADSDDLHAFDVVGVIGVKSDDVVRRLRPGQKWIYFDKAYNRDWPRWWRVSVCAHQPTNHLLRGKFPLDRARAQGWLPLPDWRTSKPGDYILLAGASAKYHKFHGLPDPTTWATILVDRLRRHTDRQIVYRPKPSWKGAVPIPGTTYREPKSRVSIERELEHTHALVTHGSSAAFDALRAGVPSIIHGNAVTREISSTSWEDIENPLRDTTRRENLVAALAYHQWTVDEIAKGEAWPFISSTMQSIT